MKISVSLPAADVVFLDEHAHVNAVGSRSAVLLRAVQLLRHAELDRAYAVAFEEWGATGEDELWDATVGDGLPTS